MNSIPWRTRIFQDNMRDVPGEFRVSQLIHKYFKYKDRREYGWS